jgi:hypothetical protein
MTSPPGRVLTFSAGPGIATGPVTDLCRSFDHISCRKGEHIWHHDPPRNSAPKQCAWPLTSGLPRKQVAADFGGGFSTLNRWIQQERRNPEKPTVQSDLEREIAEPRREPYTPVGEGCPKKGHGVLRGEKQTRFAFVEEHRRDIPVNRLCQIMDVSPRGYRVWRSRPMSVSQRKNLVVLAHIRDQFEQSLGSYGRPRMTEKLKELGLTVGHRRVGRLIKENGIKVRRNKKFKATTDSNHSFSIAPNLLNRDFSADRPNQNGLATSAMSGHRRASSTSLSSLICMPGA